MTPGGTGGTVHIIGAGLAGLAAAVRLMAAGRPVIIYEMAGQAGGRCRSFHDTTLGRRIDNGNHLLLSGNGEAMSYIAAIGASDTLWRPRRAAFEFVDLETDRRWSIRPGRGRLPLWLLDQTRRTPGSTALEHLAALKLAWAPASATVADCFDTASPLYRRFWRPLTIAVLNTEPQEAAAGLLWPVLKQTIGRGEAFCRPCIPRRGLSDSLIDPAVKFIGDRAGNIFFRRRLVALEFVGKRIGRLVFNDGPVGLADNEAVIFAAPAEAAAGLLPGLRVPTRFSAIVNAHFLLKEQVPEPGFSGLINANCQWLFVRRDMVSATVSAAAGMVELDSDKIAALLWPEISRVMGGANFPLPRYRIVKERRATIAQIPAQEPLRPATKTPWSNLMLAGDWTATALPATIEGAILSGHKAAAAILRTRPNR